jgi:predicted ATPase
MRQGLAAKQALGIQQHLPSLLGLLAGIYLKQKDPAEALNLVEDALARVERLDERWFEVELNRLRGEALLMLSRERSAEAEASFRKAIEVAQRQDAKWWELRATTSLARLWAERGERPNAYRLLAPVYGRFTEGFDTPALEAAKALLDSLT